MRFWSTSRIGLLLVLSITVVWIGTLVVFYASGSSGSSWSGRPLPGQVAALVALLERASTTDRALILRAVTSQSMTAMLVAGNQVAVTPIHQRVARLTARAIERSLAPLGGRPISVTVHGKAAGDIGFGYTFITPVDLELRLRLATGDTLVIDALRHPLTNLLGLPVGFVTGLTGTVLGLIALFALRREVAMQRLQARLSQLVQGRIAMLGGISHDVRTFLTRLRMRVERIPHEDERERAVADIADMIRLLDDALLASRAGAGELTQELVNLVQLVVDEVEDRRAAGQPMDLEVSEVITPEASVLGDRLALRRVISNLLDNALLYGQTAHVSLDLEGESVALRVDDEGPGISPDQRERMLEPFVRLETSRNRKTGGAGLGLAVARSLVEVHEGTISIAAAPSGGARLEVRLPLFVAR